MVNRTKISPYLFESEDQLEFVATCLAASNMGFHLDSNNWHDAESCLTLIKRSRNYADKTNAFLKSIGKFKESGFGLYSSVMSERENWLKFLREDGQFNKETEKYIALAEGK